MQRDQPQHGKPLAPYGFQKCRRLRGRPHRQRPAFWSRDLRVRERVRIDQTPADRVIKRSTQRPVHLSDRRRRRRSTITRATDQQSRVQLVDLACRKARQTDKADPWHDIRPTITAYFDNAASSTSRRTFSSASLPASPTCRRSRPSCAQATPWCAPDADALAPGPAALVGTFPSTCPHRIARQNPSVNRRDTSRVRRHLVGPSKSSA